MYSGMISGRINNILCNKTVFEKVKNHAKSYGLTHRLA